MSARAFFVLGLVLASLVVGWRALLPASNEASEDIAGGVAALLDSVARAQFTGAQATLETQRRMTARTLALPWRRRCASSAPMRRRIAWS